jgi:ssRNA-specific RNase YbeY (16S rRNA maturation enzyme)
MAFACCWPQVRLTHSLTHSCTHSLTHLLYYSLTHFYSLTFTHSLTHSLAHNSTLSSNNMQMSVTRRVLTRLSLPPTSSFSHHITHTRTLTHTLTHTNNTSDTLNERIIIKNSQRKFPIDINLTKKHISKILDILKMPNFGVYLLICSDAKMREINKNLRQKSKSTDILSYSLPEGAYDPLSGNKEGHSYLGTLVICPAFVNRQMLADKEAFEVHCS